MIEEEDYDDQTLKYISEMNFSYFTDKYHKMLSTEFPEDKHHELQKKWIQIIRTAVRSSNIKAVIIFLYSAKTRACHCRNILLNYFGQWKNKFQVRHQIRNNWNKLSNQVVSLNQKEFMNDVKDKVHELRANRASSFLASLPQFQNPNFGLFLKQVEDNQIDDSATRIGFRKREKYGLCTTTTQTPTKNLNAFEEEEDISS